MVKAKQTPAKEKKPDLISREDFLYDYYFSRIIELLEEINSKLTSKGE